MRYIVRLSVENKSRAWFVKNIELSANELKYVLIIVGIAKGNGCCIDQIPAIVLPKIAFNELAYELTQDERYMY